MKIVAVAGAALVGIASFAGPALASEPTQERYLHFKGDKTAIVDCLARQFDDLATLFCEETWAKARIAVKDSSGVTLRGTTFRDVLSGQAVGTVACSSPTDAFVKFKLSDPDIDSLGDRWDAMARYRC